MGAVLEWGAWMHVQGWGVHLRLGESVCAGDVQAASKWVRLWLTAWCSPQLAAAACCCCGALSRTCCRPPLPAPWPRLLLRRCVAYPLLLDSLHLRLHCMREVLRKHMGQGDDVLVSTGCGCLDEECCVVRPCCGTTLTLPCCSATIHQLCPPPARPAGLPVPALRRHLHLPGCASPGGPNERRLPLRRVPRGAGCQPGCNGAG